MESERSTLSNRLDYSCNRCSDRKVKCNRQQPCSACIKQNVQCIFRPARQSQKKLKRLKREALTDRVQRCEALLKERGLDPKEYSQQESDRADDSHHRGESFQADSNSQFPTPVSVTSILGASSSKSPFASTEGRTEFVDNSMMTQVMEELLHTERSSHELSQDESDTDDTEDGFDLVIRHHRGKYTHPPIDQIYELLQVFTENVDPITKIVHVPTLRLTFKKATSNIDNVPTSFNALMFAIYSISVLSLTDPECRDRFGQPRSNLLSHYIRATKVALARADFTSSTNIVVLQALILYTLSIRETQDPRSLWILSGVAIRIAEGIGLHRDAKSLGIAPFDAEIRCRIWCYLKTLDNHAAQMCGQPKFRHFDTDMNIDKILANVSDNEIYPAMTSLPPDSSRPTEMVFCTVMSEFSAFASRMAAINRRNGGMNFASDAFASKESTMPDEEAMRDIEEKIEIKYLYYCDPSEPLQLMTTLFARCSINVARFMAHHPRKWQSPDHMPEVERKYVWKISIKLLEQFDMAISARQLQKFAWNSTHYLQWSVFIHFLDTLRSDPLVEDHAKAWRLVEAIFQNIPRILTNTKRPMYVAIGNLCLKAFGARETTMLREKGLNIRTPDFILQLRQQREDASIRERAKNSSRKKIDGPPLQTCEAESHLDVGVDITQSRLPQRQSANDRNHQSQGTEQSIFPIHSSDNLYQWTDDMNTMEWNASNSNLDSSTSLMLCQDQNQDQDQGMGNTVAQTIDWRQWDAWLSDMSFQHMNMQWP